MVKLLVLFFCAALAITSATQTRHRDVDVGTGNVPTNKGASKVAATTISSTKVSPTMLTSSDVAPTKEVPTKPTVDTPSPPTKPTDATPTKPTDATPTKPTDATPTKPTDATPSSTSKPTDPTPTTPTKSTPSTSPASTIKPTPPHCKPGQKKGINGSCRDYVECNMSFQWVQKSCTTFCQVFDGTKSRCVWNWQSPCLKPPTTVDPPSTPEASTPSPESTPQPSSTPSGSTTSPDPTTPKAECTNGQKKLYKAGDCKDYLECDSGSWIEKSCSVSHYFDVDSLSCKLTWPWHKC